MGMVKFEQAFKNAVSDAKREVLVAQIRSHPEMTVSDLGKLSTGDLGALLRLITIGDIMSTVNRAKKRGPGRPPSAVSAPTPASTPDLAPVTRRSAPKAAAPVSAGEVNTRTQEGREAYDKAILALLRSSSTPMAAPDLKGQLGGTSLQVRTALNRLISNAQVSYTGKARGTRYRAV
jgi:hypothetical protein